MPDSSTDCSPCRLEWRPSRWHAAAVMGLWALAAFSLLATRWAEDVPDGFGALLLVIAAGVGLHAARGLLHTRPGILELLADGRARWMPGAGADGSPPVAVEGAARAHEQWPVTTLRFAACGTTVVFWPDNLCGPERRLLRRWARSTMSSSPLPQFWMG